MTNFSELLSIHHVGGRDGSSAFPLNNVFLDDVALVLYDADPDCLPQARERNNRFRNLWVLPYCLAAKRSKRSFFLNYDPFTSSLLSANPQFRDFYTYCVDPIAGPMDYRCADALAPVEKRDVETISFDEIFSQRRTGTPPPDFLSLDTQGSEYEILEGSASLLDSTVLGLQVEVEFVPLYSEQRLFGDIHRLLASHGFYFSHFASLLELSPHRAPVGLRGKGMTCVGEAVFIKDVNSITGTSQSVTAKLLKLAFISLSYGKVEYALMCLHLAQERLPPDQWVHKGTTTRKYLEFLAAVVQAETVMPREMPPTFSARYTFNESQSRFIEDIHSGSVSKHGNALAELILILKQHFPPGRFDRICVVPFGSVAREFVEDKHSVDSDTIPIVFCDNDSRAQQNYPHAQFVSFDQIGPSDFVIITSYSFEKELKSQLAVRCGVTHEQLMTIRDFATKQPLPWEKQDDSPFERTLKSWGFADTARIVREARLEQSNALKYWETMYRRGAAPQGQV